MVQAAGRVTLGAIAAAICAAPALTVVALALTRGGDGAIAPTLMRDAVFGTAAMLVVAGGASVIVGAVSAWLVTLCDFPGRRAFEWLLALPLAAPFYVLAYAYAALTWAGGPLPLPLTGFAGAAFVSAIGAYPYVFLSARAAYATSSACALEAAQTLGAQPLDLFVRVAAPLAWPGIAAGGALACMEIAADYGAAQHFGVTTISAAVFRAWYDYGAPRLALKLALILVAAAFVLLALERIARGARGFAGGSARWRPLPRYALAPVAAYAAAAFCAALVVLGAILPLVWLARLALFRPLSEHAHLVEPLLNSLTLAGSGGALTLVLAFVIAAAARTRDLWGGAALFAANAGYAAPGAIVAIGALALFAALRDAGLVAGASAALSLAGLLWIYAARFAAAGAQPIDAGLARLSNGLDAAARTSGAPLLQRLMRVDLPIAAPGAAAGALVIFVEILKELPATLILRPFDFDTLAVKAYAYASDERMQQAAAPALIVALAGMAPIIILSRAVMRLRAGAEAS